jgi:hypothetical protein
VREIQRRRGRQGVSGVEGLLGGQLQNSIQEPAVLCLCSRCSSDPLEFVNLQIPWKLEFTHGNHHFRCSYPRNAPTPLRLLPT